MRVVLAVMFAVSLAVLSAGTAAPQPRIVVGADQRGKHSGEIYSFDLVTGARHDISRSLASESGPAVSPDGKTIAFGSTRSGALALYIARIDGSGVRLVKQFHAGLNTLEIAWAPDGGRLAAVATCCGRVNELWIGTPGGFGVTRWDAEAYEPTAWSSDGRYFAYVAHDPVVPDNPVLNVVGADGRFLWHRQANQLRDLGWSADDRLAWSATGTVHLTTAAGKALPGFPAEDVAWSPDGRVLAAVRKHAIELRTDGTGAPRTVYRPVAGRRLSSGIRWLGARHLVVTPQDGDGVLRVDVGTGKAAIVGYEDVVGVVSPDQQLIASAYWPSADRERSLRVGALLGSSGRVIAETRDCPDDHADPYIHYQFVPGKRMVVYLADCPDLAADLYSLRADGSGLRRLTYTAAHEETPVLSPDGAHIAYIRSASVGHACSGCPSELWVMNSDGAHARRLTAPGVKNATGDWDANPSWSPDGKSILFDRSAAESTLGLMVIGVEGGTPRSLHLPGARHGVWGPHRIAYSGQLGALWTAKPDGSDRRMVAPRHTCDSGCFYAWVPQGLVWATLRTYVTHSTLWIRGAGGQRRVQLPFRPTRVAWLDGMLLVTPPPANWPVVPWSEGDLYRVQADGSLTRLTNGLGTVSITN